MTTIMGEGHTVLAEAYYQRGLVRAMRKEMSGGRLETFSRAIGEVPYRAELYEARAAAMNFLGNSRNAEQDREEADRAGKPANASADR